MDFRGSARFKRFRSPKDCTDIVKTLFEALALVVDRRIHFLARLRATLIPLCAVPGVIDWHVRFVPLGSDFQLNTLSLFGLVLAIDWWSMTRLSSLKRSNVTLRKE